MSKVEIQTSWLTGWQRTSLKLQCCPESMPGDAVHRRCRANGPHQEIIPWGARGGFLSTGRCHASKLRGAGRRGLWEASSCCEAFPGGAKGSLLMRSATSGTLLQSCLKACLPRGKSQAVQASVQRSTQEPARETPSSSSVPPVPSTVKAQHCTSQQKMNVYKSSSTITEQTNRTSLELKGNTLNT